jgi:uncharacterized membrane protein YoaT (DUF817 family)
MSDSLFLWYGIFSVLLASFLFIIYKEKNRKLYLLYFLTGMAFGLYFDIVSFTSGYYSYPDFYPMKISGLPLSMTIAEGFSVAITMKLFELSGKRFTQS